MTIPGVVGVGEGLFEKKPCLKVFVVKRTPEIEQKIPKTFGDYPVLIEETGEVRALPGSRG